MALVVLASAGFLSCSDEGAVFERLTITSITPSPDAVAVDKAQGVFISFNKPVRFSEIGKIQLKYAGTGEAIPFGTGWEGPLIVFSDQWWLNGTPWKPGRTVEVWIPGDLADQEGRILGQAKHFSFSVAIDSVPFAITATRPAQNDSVTIDQSGNVYGAFTFNDYFLEFPDSALSISPPVPIHILRVVVIANSSTSPRTGVYLMKECRFLLEGVRPGTKYDMTVPASVHDYEGETLAGDYHLVFFTKP